MANTCEFHKKDGTTCGANAQGGKKVCVFHDPARASDGRRARRAGGLSRSPPRVLPADIPLVQLNSCKDVAGVLAESINQVRQGELDPRIANATGYLAGILLKALEQGVIEDRLRKIEDPSDSQQRSLQRMKTTILKRIRRAEVLAKEKSRAKQLARCTCFPEHDKSPFFLYPGIEELASSLKCPLHGHRFRYSRALDADASEIDLEVGWVWRHASEQYRKAWNATFQDSSWPAEEIEVLGRKWLLPRSPEGELMDWQNASPLPPWKSAHALALTLETH